ncbi:MAG: phage minor capsid protein [Bacillota bacterium]
MAKIPEPNYDYNAEKLVEEYRKAILRIKRQLETLDLTNTQRAHYTAVLKEIGKVVSELDQTMLTWVNDNIPIAVTEGTARALVELELVATFDEALKIEKFNKLNTELIRIAIADTQQDLLQANQNVTKRVRNTIREVFAEVMRENMSEGVNGYKTISSETISRLRQKLNDVTDKSVIYSNGSRRSLEDYVDTVTRTKMSRTYTEATINESVSREVYYGQISKHGAKDDCRLWEGKIVKLSPNAPGDYPYVYSLPNRQIFHPRCKHHVSPVRNPDRIG